jgi:hypothetical protein
LAIRDDGSIVDTLISSTLREAPIGKADVGTINPRITKKQVIYPVPI